MDMVTKRGYRAIREVPYFNGLVGRARDELCEIRIEGYGVHGAQVTVKCQVTMRVNRRVAGYCNILMFPECSVKV